MLCSFIQRWPQQNWSDIPKLHGDENISQCSDFNSTPWGNIVSSHYSSSTGRHTHFMQLLSSVARVFSCAPETKAYVMYKLLNSCHVATKDHSARIKIFKWLHRNFIIILGVRYIKHHSLDEMIICWNGVAYKIRVMNPLDTVIFLLSVLNMLSCSVTGTSPMIHTRSPFIFAACSVYRMPQITALVDSCCSNSQQNCEGLYGEPCQLPWVVNDVSNLPPQTPSASTAMGKDLSLLIITCISHHWHRRWIIPGAGRPCLFILIGSICGTAVDGGGWCWQRFVHAFPWQQYSWQARQQAVHTRLINTNNRAVNQE